MGDEDGRCTVVSDVVDVLEWALYTCERVCFLMEWTPVAGVDLMGGLIDKAATRTGWRCGFVIL